MARDLRPGGDICCETCGEWVNGVDAHGDCDVCSQKANARANAEVLRTLVASPVGARLGVWFPRGWPLSRYDALADAGWVSRAPEDDGWRYTITAVGRAALLAAEADGAA